MKKNQKVTIVVSTPWATTEEEGVIRKISGNKIFIEGLDIPFNKITGIKEDCFFGSKVYIKELLTKK